LCIKNIWPSPQLAIRSSAWAKVLHKIFSENIGTDLLESFLASSAKPSMGTASLYTSVALEISRSANGAHAWIFFAGPVPVSSRNKRAGRA
ncbi:MAG: hypothetical protein K9K65_19215, partial [Desulfarculaceae bacterium]|nr:hypothetical protein [Desulfarculaceae bacterium]